MTKTPLSVSGTSEASGDMFPAGLKVPGIYRAGTLTYSMAGLCALFGWLLWGDFTMGFFESIFSKFLPLYLNSIHASNALIGIMTGSLAGGFNLLFLPNFSQWSDRYRGHRGRRIPFIYFSTAPTVIFLIGIGFAPEIAGWTHSQLIARLAPSVSLVSVILTFLCFSILAFHFFNMVLINSYNWLLRDVVPMEWMSRFIAYFRVVSTLSSVGFLWFVFPHLLTHRKEVFLGIGGFYLVSFMLMSWKVKEGEYPPPTPPAERPGILKSYGLYFRDSLSVAIYRNNLIAYVLVTAVTAASPFGMLFMRQTLGFAMLDIGHIFAWGAAVSAVAFVPMGWLCDRISPIRVCVISLFIQLVVSALAYLFVDTRTSYLVYFIVSAIPGAGWAAGSLITMMKLYPKERFGEFSSALACFGTVSGILSNCVMGFFMDLAHSNYRMSFLWCAACFGLAIYPMMLVYRGWRLHGGPHNYLPPLPGQGTAQP